MNVGWNNMMMYTSNISKSNTTHIIHIEISLYIKDTNELKHKKFVNNSDAAQTQHPITIHNVSKIVKLSYNIYLVYLKVLCTVAEELKLIKERCRDINYLTWFTCVT